MKTCPRCKEPKEFSAFAKRRDRKSGLVSWCRKCTSSYTSANRNKAKQRAYDSAYRKANPEKNRASVKRWRANHPEEAKAINDEYFAKNPEKAKIYTASYREKNPDLGRICAHNRRARIRATATKLSKDIVAILFAEQNGKCPYCF